MRQRDGDIERWRRQRGLQEIQNYISMLHSITNTTEAET